MSRVRHLQSPDLFFILIRRVHPCIHIWHTHFYHFTIPHHQSSCKVVAKAITSQGMDRSRKQDVQTRIRREALHLKHQAAMAAEAVVEPCLSTPVFQITSFISQLCKIPGKIINVGSQHAKYLHLANVP